MVFGCFRKWPFVAPQWPLNMKIHQPWSQNLKTHHKLGLGDKPLIHAFFPVSGAAHPSVRSFLSIASSVFFFGEFIYPLVMTNIWEMALIESSMVYRT